MMSSDEEHQEGSQDEEHEDMDDEPSKEKDERLSFTNFMFGNVDKKGKLENDFLDEVCI